MPTLAISRWRKYVFWLSVHARVRSCCHRAWSYATMLWRRYVVNCLWELCQLHNLDDVGDKDKIFRF